MPSRGPPDTRDGGAKQFGAHASVSCHGPAAVEVPCATPRCALQARAKDSWRLATCAPVRGEAASDAGERQR